jgi:hypothetical protein
MIVLCPAGSGSTGAAYDPVADRWRPISAVGSGNLSGTLPLAWTGREIIVLSRVRSARYDPATDTWRPIPDNPGLDDRDGATTVWDGTGVLVWGGARLGPFALFDDGFRYIPPGY